MKRLLHIAFLFICTAISATNYYVKNGGSDQASGLSPVNAWTTVNKVNLSMRIFKPGDSILFHCGDSWPNSTILIGTSGLKGKNIVLGSYGSGNKPVIEALPNLAAIMVTEAEKGYWTIDNLELRASGKFKGDFNTVAIHHGYWKNDLGAVPGWIIQNCYFNSCLFLSGPNTIVRKSVFNGAGNINNDGGAISFRGPECDSCIVENNIISDYYDRGIWIYNGGSYPIFRNNIINNIHEGSDHGGSGINIDGYGVRVTYGEINNNTIKNADMAAITFENGYRSSVYNNMTENCTGVMIWQYHEYAETGEIDIHHNIFHNGNNGVVILNAKRINIVNNTFVKDNFTGNDKIALYIISDTQFVSEISFRNNIVTGTWSHLVKIPDLKDIWSEFDYNIMLSKSGWIMNRAGKNLTLSQLKSMGYMHNGISSNPLFINESSDWHLRAGSPAINRGIQAGYKYDLDGKPIDNLPDIGALEFIGDSTAAQLTGCSVKNESPDVIEMNFTMPLADTIPDISAFLITVNSTEYPVDRIVISGSKILLTLEWPVSYADIVKISYKKPATGQIQSINGKPVENFEGLPVLNEVMANGIITPELINARIQDALPDIIELKYDLPLADIMPPISAFSVNLNLKEISINSIRIYSTGVSVILNSPVLFGDRVTIEYKKPDVNPLQAVNGGIANSFSPSMVLNEVRTTKFVIFPNPASDYLTIAVPMHIKEKISIRITDFNNKLLLDSGPADPSDQLTIPLRLRPGSYVIHIISGINILHSGVLIVQ